MRIDGLALVTHTPHPLCFFNVIQCHPPVVYICCLAIDVTPHSTLNPCLRLIHSAMAVRDFFFRPQKRLVQGLEKNIHVVKEDPPDPGFVFKLCKAELSSLAEAISRTSVAIAEVCSEAVRIALISTR